jgi:protocatechuate 3,4-dioxygenase beta subunit
MNDETKITRRTSLLAGAAAAIGWKLTDTGSGVAAVEQGLVQCVLTPELTEGPYYVAGERVRRDVRDGKRGAILLLGIKVVNARTCKPIGKASVDIWHCDAAGNYSSGSEHFLRGVQRTDSSGVATFKTIYPGFYPGRAVHIHVKVHVGGNVVHTGQLFFPPATTRTVYAKAPYRAHGTEPDTPNPQDAIYRNGGSKTIVKVTKGLTGAVTLGVVE